jgi:hypothetical protein
MRDHWIADSDGLPVGSTGDPNKKVMPIAPTNVGTCVLQLKGSSALGCPAENLERLDLDRIERLDSSLPNSGVKF